MSREIIKIDISTRYAGRIIDLLTVLDCEINNSNREYIELKKEELKKEIDLIQKGLLRKMDKAILDYLKCKEHE